MHCNTVRKIRPPLEVYRRVGVFFPRECHSDKMIFTWKLIAAVLVKCYLLISVCSWGESAQNCKSVQGGFSRAFKKVNSPCPCPSPHRPTPPFLLLSFWF